MTHAFVPLAPGALRAATDPSAPTRTKPISSDHQALFQPKTVPPPSESVPSHQTHGEPKITLERQGEVITHIRIQCACGQVIELQCAY